MTPETLQSAPGSSPVGRWLITATPSGWAFLPGYGLREEAPTASPSSLLLSEDRLPGGDRLAPYVQSQNDLIAKNYPLTQIAGPAAASIHGTQEAQMLLLKHRGSDGSTFFQIQTYALLGKWIGIVTLTATEPNIGTARTAMNAVLAGLRVLPEPSSPPP
jgi:hypothetical protein